MAYRFNSKGSGSFFGSYISKTAADEDATAANLEQKNGMDDWEPEEKEAAPEALSEEVEMSLKALRKSLVKAISKKSE